VLVLAGVSVKAQTITETFGSGANAFSIEFVTIGNPSNAPDISGVGAVSYVYNLGKYEISRQMIEKANLSGNLEISISDLDEQPAYGGNGPDRPATGIGRFEATRFVNWLNTSRGFSAAYKVNSEGYLLNWAEEDDGYSSSNPLRNSLAKFWIPSLDEWHKGAYGSPDGLWYQYPTGSNTPPTAVGAGTLANTAIYGAINGFADITNAGGESAWGTMAQGGNAWEFVENGQSLGGVWSNGDATFMQNSVTFGYLLFTDEGYYDGGFRIAGVPEPSSLSLLLAGGAVLMAGRRRKI
jgi:hypothetical protein